MNEAKNTVIVVSFISLDFLLGAPIKLRATWFPRKSRASPSCLQRGFCVFNESVVHMLRGIVPGSLFQAFFCIYFVESLDFIRFVCVRC